MVSPTSGSNGKSPVPVDLTKHFDDLPYAIGMKIARAIKEPLKWMAATFGVAGFAPIVASEVCIMAAPLLLTITASCFVAALLSFAFHKAMASCSERWQESASVAVEECIRELSGLDSPPAEDDRALVLLRRYGAEVRHLTVPGSQLVDADNKKWDKGRLDAYIKAIATYCPNLCELQLNTLDLNGVDVSPLKNVTLNTLSLESCKCADATLDELIANRPLEGLHLIDCHDITQAPLEKMDTSELTELTLKGSRLSPLQTVSDPEALVQKWLGDQLKAKKLSSPQEMFIAKRQLEADLYWRRDDIIDQVECDDPDGDIPVLDRDKLKFLADCSRLQKLTISHLDDEALRDIIAPLPKLEELTITFSYKLTGAGFDAYSSRDRWHTFNSKLTTLIIGCCPFLEPSVIDHWNSYWRLQTLHFPLAVSTISYDISDIPAARASLRQHFRPADKYDSPPDDIVGTWQRK